MPENKVLKSLRNKQNHIKRRILGRCADCQKLGGLRISVKIQLGKNKPEKKIFEPIEKTERVTRDITVLMTEIQSSAKSFTTVYPESKEQM